MTMSKSALLILAVLISMSSCNQETRMWDDLMQNGSSSFQEIMSNPDKYELQIIYTKLEKDSTESWLLYQDRFHVDTTKYFYPASTVKMPVAFLALERLNQLVREGYQVSKDTPLKIFRSRDSQSEVIADSSSITGYPSIGHYINKLFAVSDNDAYNRLYEFLGRDYINASLRSKKIFSNSRIVSRVGVSGFNYEENAYSNAIEFYSPDSILYRKEASQSTGNFLDRLSGDQKGKGYYIDGQEERVDKSFDMSEKNFINLVDLQESLQRIIIPEYYDEKERYDLSSSDYTFLKDALSNLPKTYSHPKYDTSYYYDSYVKFFMYGDTKKSIPTDIKIYNKVGYAYGTLTDCAFIEDKKNDIRFFLSATLLVNENEIFNDDDYEYDKGIAFLAELGRLIYAHEIKTIQ